MIGLDFGTSTSLLAQSTLLRNSIVPLGATTSWLPSIAALDGDNWFLCDDASSLPEDQTVRSIKRMITLGDHTATLSDGVNFVEVDADSVIVSILSKIAFIANDAFLDLGEPDAVRLGCPAMWDGEQRRRLVRLANAAGIPVGSATVIDEPIAAGVEWVSQRVAAGHTIRGKVLVFDMGGGTLDVAVLNVDAAPGREPSISVQSAVSDVKAGDSLDEAMTANLEREFAARGVPIGSGIQRDELRGWIKAAVRRAKLELTDMTETTVVVGHPRVDFPPVPYSREELEDAFRPQMVEAMDVVWRALRAALMTQVKSPTEQVSLTPRQARGLTESELTRGVTAVILAGGMSQIPMVQNELAEHFGADLVHLGTGSTGVAELIALGLSNDSTYERMNLHRPGFDILLRWTDEASSEVREELVYAAYTPLYRVDDAINTDQVKYRWAGPSSLPTKGEGMLVVRSTANEPIAFRVADREVEGLRFQFGRGEFLVTLEPNGRVFWKDSTGRQTVVRVARWPVIRGKGIESIIIESINDESSSKYKLEDLPWHLRPYD
ncbi:MAG: Hsp70 family protein [Kineosporiaceae bacterium]|nr:Hsp70 family protein [Aeromicrobium sp.]